MVSDMYRRNPCFALLAGAIAVGLCVFLPRASLAEDSEATWASIRPDIFGERPIEDGSALVRLTAPARAEDAALVPLDIHLNPPAGDGRDISSLTLIVDENPAPVAATFKFVPQHKAFDLSTRVRVNAYSFVRVVAETEDGKLYMVKSYVKAAGGCSAPAVKDPEEAKANLGKMRFRNFAETGRNEAQLQIRHPNYSGLQMDQVTRLYTPAWFVQTIKVTQGEKLVFSMEGGISISEDPTFRFSFVATNEPVSVEATDTDGSTFRERFPARNGS
jgi:sulfur-oxidizing protein SoxY